MKERLYTLFAQGQTQIDPGDVGVTRIDDPSATIAGILSAVYLIAGITCVIVIIVGGYMFTTAAGDASLVKKAREMIVGAIIGLVVIIMAFTITMFILGRFTA